MQCHNCKWRDKPAEVRREHCIACSQDHYQRHRFNSNELSNAGQTFISYDNHNSEMQDDRDVASQTSKEYLLTRRSLSDPRVPHPVKAISKDLDTEIPEIAYEFIKKFLYEIYSLTEIQELLLSAIIQGKPFCEFARNHGMTEAAVTKNVKIIIQRSPIVMNYVRNATGGKMRISNRGRKPTKPDKPLTDKVAKKVEYVGAFQQSFGF